MTDTTNTPVLDVLDAGPGLVAEGLGKSYKRRPVLRALRNLHPFLREVRFFPILLDDAFYQIPPNQVAFGFQVDRHRRGDRA